MAPSHAETYAKGSGYNFHSSFTAIGPSALLRRLRSSMTMSLLFNGGVAAVSVYWIFTTHVLVNSDPCCVVEVSTSNEPIAMVRLKNRVTGRVHEHVAVRNPTTGHHCHYYYPIFTPLYAYRAFMHPQTVQVSVDLTKELDESVLRIVEPRSQHRSGALLPPTPSVGQDTSQQRRNAEGRRFALQLRAKVQPEFTYEGVSGNRQQVVAALQGCATAAVQKQFCDWYGDAIQRENRNTAVPLLQEMVKQGRVSLIHERPTVEAVLCGGKSIDSCAEDLGQLSRQVLDALRQRMNDHAVLHDISAALVPLSS